MNPAAQVVQPAYPEPPHWKYCCTVHPGGDDDVDVPEDVVVLVDEVDIDVVVVIVDLDVVVVVEIVEVVELDVDLLVVVEVVDPEPPEIVPLA